jgi:GDP-L-fucose synthase
MAAERYNKAEPVNLGTGREITIRELVGLIVELTGFKGDIVWDHSQPDGQPRRCLDVSRAEKEFGFKAQVPFREGLRRTTEWYVNNDPS